MLTTKVIHNAAAVTSASTFLLALYTGIYFHYTRVVKTHLGSYPTEWLPSVSSVIGDHFPERSIFQYGMALTAVFRFTSVYLYYLEHQFAPSARVVFILDLLKTLSIGGFTYVTSTDSVMFHSVCEAAYIIFSISSMVLKRKNRPLLFTYLADVSCMCWWLYQHNVKSVPGSYSMQAVFEWTLPLLDILFDWSATWDADSLLIYPHLFKSELPYLWNALIFWTNVTMLPMSLWYFPLWNMGLSGYEVTLLAYLAPMLICLRSFKENQHILSLASALGITVGNLEHLSPQTRLLMVSLGTAASMIFWFDNIAKSKKYAISYLLSGLVLSSTIKYSFDSLNPLWNTILKNHLNKSIICGIHLIATACLIPLPTFSKRYNVSMMQSIGVGTTLFVLHTYFTDSGSLLLWTPWRSSVGNLVVLSLMTVGLHWIPPVLIQVPIFVFGGFPLMQMTISRTLLESISDLVTSPIHLLGALCTYLILLLADVWTVAYAFVPMGNLLRERSGLVFSLSIGLQFFTYIKLWRRQTGRALDSLTIETASVVLLSALILSTCVQQHVQHHQSELVTIKDPNVLTVGIWTVHFGMDDHMYSSHQNMTELIRQLDLDVVGLLESDTMRNIAGNRNLMLYLARKLNMHYVYGPTPRQNTWGCSLLSKYPIIRHRVHLLPSPVGELACAVQATIQTRNGKNVNVFISHNGQEEDLQDRLLQTSRIAQILNDIELPVVFAGYLVTKPGIENPVYRLMVDDGRMKDILPSDKYRWCEYIFYRDLLPLGYARISHGKVTDTELQTAKFWIGDQTDFIQMNDNNMYPRSLLGEGYNGHRYHVYTGPIYDPLNYNL